MSVRLVVLWALLAATLLMRSTPVVAQCGGEECDYDILIIGCGGCGVGAAREIENFNQNGLDEDPSWEPLFWGIFETEDSCGGRGVAANFVNGADQNVLAADLDLYNIPYNFLDANSVSYFDENGDVFDQNVVDDVRARWASTYRCLEEVCVLWFNDIDGPDDDIGLRNLIEEIDEYCPSEFTDLTNEIDWSEDSEYMPDSGNIASGQEWFSLDFDSSTLPEKMSMYNLPLLPYKNEFNFITGDESYASLVNAIVANELEDSDNGEINLESTVTKVEPMDSNGDLTTWDQATWSRVTVTYESGETEVYSAENVIPTMSVGVLKQSGRAVFGTSIEPKLAAMDFVYEMVVYKPIFIQFPNKFWAEYNTAFLNVETATRGRCHTWQSYDIEPEEFYPESNFLVCPVPDYIFEDVKEEQGIGTGVFKIPQAAVMELLRESLGKVFPTEFWNTIDCEEGNQFAFSFNQQPPDADQCTYYTFPEPNPNWLGSYINWKVNADGDEADAKFSEFIRPLPNYDNPHLIPSGSAVCDEHSGFFQGAYLAGVQAANYAIDWHYDREFPFEDEDDQCFSDYYEANPLPCKVDSYKLWNADENIVVQDSFDGTTDICKEDFDFSIEAIATSRFSCESVRFKLTGPGGYSHTQMESQRPYMLFGNADRPPIDVVGARIDELPVGRYTLTARASNGVDMPEKQDLQFNVAFCNAKPPDGGGKLLACFAGSNLIEVQGKGRIAMDSLQIGDSVRDGRQNQFSRVISFIHLDRDAEAEFLQIHTEKSKAPLEITPEHMVFVSGTAVPASKIKVGDILGESKVSAIQTIKRRGVYAPVTESGTLIVSGSIVSSYANVLPHSFVNQHHGAHAFFGLRRLVCAFDFGICENETYNEEGIPDWLSSVFEIAKRAQDNAIAQIALSLVGLLVIVVVYLLEKVLLSSLVVGMLLLGGLFVAKKMTKTSNKIKNL